MISVILPVWNGENYLAEAIRSILEQTYAPLEILIVNDGSTDGTQKIIDSFGDQVRCIQQKNNGLGASRNAAIRIAKGNYFAFLDHDDFWEPNKLALQMEAMSSSDPLLFTQVQQFICPALPEEERKKLIVNKAILPGYIAGTLLISKERFEQVGPFGEEIKQLGEFVEWYLRAFNNNFPIQMLPILGLHRRVHQSNMGRRDLSRRSDYLRILKASLDRRRSLACV